MMKNLSDIAHFERLYQQDADPWQLQQRWYEQRKRALTLACLPQPRYRSAYEPGCGNGMMTVALAQRCDQLIASDGAPTAVQLTKERVLQEAPHASVSVEQHALPGQWPQQQFDLILISEIAYYLAIPAFRELQAKAVVSLAPGGTLILCHWRGVFEDRAQPTEAVHGAFHDDPALHSLCRYEDAEILIEAWSNSA
ncbi:bifunctional 2-polyprenyl-6-hydroxyphenol methylase/3-demethylubiquinol 3-O-methyltransferase UbiG [Glaciimonas sp. PAMC28666]|uniref:class I SAM-dependent methyltransferase n=1 Tax=Glaciimonas sp. PAMC28666 TaxID=2807626 RepID=UPI001965A486|nr:class I SAM-dependent methyltransferase [Glaciimonas sp. PAMC28666]QRX84081.1 methyltransferase domain-containing protein [Glaciimonas sp. PAMC28666]